MPPVLALPAANPVQYLRSPRFRRGVLDIAVVRLSYRYCICIITIVAPTYLSTLSHPYPYPLLMLLRKLTPPKSGVSRGTPCTQCLDFIMPDAYASPMPAPRSHLLPLPTLLSDMSARGYGILCVCVYGPPLLSLCVHGTSFFLPGPRTGTFGCIMTSHVYSVFIW